MKINQTPTLSSEAAAIAAQPAFAKSTQPSQLVPQILLDSMAQLRAVLTNIEIYYKANEPLRDCLQSSYYAIDDNLHNVASEIAEMMRVEMLENTFYSFNQESEVQNA